MAKIENEVGVRIKFYQKSLEILDGLKICNCQTLTMLLHLGALTGTYKRQLLSSQRSMKLPIDKSQQLSEKKYYLNRAYEVQSKLLYNKIKPGSDGDTAKLYYHLSFTVQEPLKRKYYLDLALNVYDQNLHIEARRTAKICTALGDNSEKKEEKLKWYNRALSIYKKLGNNRNSHIAYCYVQLAHVIEDKAIKTAHLSEAITIHQEQKIANKLTANIYYDLGKIETDPEIKRGYFNSAMHILDTITKGNQLKARINKCLADMDKEPSKKREYIKEALKAISKKSKETLLMADLYQDLCLIELHAGDSAAADINQKICDSIKKSLKKGR